MPLVRRVPKRGFTNIFRVEWTEVNLARLDKFAAGDEVTPEALVAKGIIKSREADRVKLLGNGELDIALTIKVHAASAGAKKKVEQAGGTVSLLGDEATTS